MAEGEIIKGKSSSITNVYRIADKEIVYTFYGNNVSNLTWIPGEDKLSYLIKEGTGNSLYTYDIEQQKMERLFRDDQTISSFSWSPTGVILSITKMRITPRKNGNSANSTGSKIDRLIIAIGISYANMIWQRAYILA